MALSKAETEFAKAMYINGYIEGRKVAITGQTIGQIISEEETEKAWQESKAKRICEKVED